MKEKLQYYRKSLVTLRNSVDHLLSEMDADLKTAPSSPRKKRAPVMQFTEKGWRKPKELLKNSK